MLLLEIRVHLVFHTGTYKVGKDDKIFPSSSVSSVPEQAKKMCE